MARLPASEIDSGVGKSGSPALRLITGLPLRFSSRARADTARVAEGRIASTRGLNDMASFTFDILNNVFRDRRRLPPAYGFDVIGCGQ